MRCEPWRSYAYKWLTIKDEEIPPRISFMICMIPYHYIRLSKVNGKEYLIVGGEDHQNR